MGNQPKQSIKFPRPNIQNYQLLVATSQYKIWKSQLYNQTIQQYTLLFPDQSQYQFQLSLLDLRHKNNNIVQALYFSNANIEQFCATYSKASIFLQRIPLRLSDIKDVQYLNMLYLIQSCLNGYYTLYKRFGYFKIQENMIGINLEGKVKVWIHQNFSKSFPDRLTSDYIGHEHDMVSRIISIIQNKSINLVNNKINFIYQERYISFQESFSTLNEYLSKKNIKTVNQIDFAKIKIIKSQKLLADQLSNKKKVNLSRAINIKNMTSRKMSYQIKSNQKTQRVQKQYIDKKMALSPHNFEKRKITFQKQFKPITNFNTNISNYPLNNNIIFSQKHKSPVGRINIAQSLGILQRAQLKYQQNQNLIKYKRQNYLSRHKSNDLKIRFTYCSPQNTNHYSLPKRPAYRKQDQAIQKQNIIKTQRKYEKIDDNKIINMQKQKQRVEQIVKVKTIQEQEVKKNVNEGEKLKLFETNDRILKLSQLIIPSKLQFKGKNKIQRKQQKDDFFSTKRSKLTQQIIKIESINNQNSDNDNTRIIQSKTHKKSSSRQLYNKKQNQKLELIFNAQQSIKKQTSNNLFNQQQYSLSIQKHHNQSNTFNLKNIIQQIDQPDDHFNYNQSKSKAQNDSLADQVNQLQNQINHKKQYKFFNKVNMSQSINLHPILFKKTHPTLRQTT